MAITVAVSSEVEQYCWVDRLSFPAVEWCANRSDWCREELGSDQFQLLRLWGLLHSGLFQTLADNGCVKTVSYPLWSFSDIGR